MEQINERELYAINGGALPQTTSDWFEFAGDIAMCFVAPSVGVPILILKRVID